VRRLLLVGRYPPACCSSRLPVFLLRLLQKVNGAQCQQLSLAFLLAWLEPSYQQLGCVCVWGGGFALAAALISYQLSPPTPWPLAVAGAPISCYMAHPTPHAPHTRRWAVVWLGLSGKG
jgi:hypothetical protein